VQFDALDARFDAIGEVVPVDVEHTDVTTDRSEAEVSDDIFAGLDVSAPMDVAWDVPIDIVATPVDIPPTDASGPPPVYATTDVLVDKVFASFDLTFVVSRDGRLWGWGGELGRAISPADLADPSIREYRVRPQRIDGVDSVLEWSVLFGFGECVLSGPRGSAAVYCWGRTAYGSWGRGYGDSWDDWRFPHRMGTVSDVLRFASGEVIRSDLSAWRPNSRDAGWRRFDDHAGHLIQSVHPGVDRLENGVQPQSFLSNYMDTSLQVIPGIADLVGAPDFACLLMETGRVMCWGMNYGAQTGNGFEGTEVCHWTVRDSATTSHTAHALCVRRPTEVPGLTDVVKLAANEGRVCVIRRGGTVWCWGETAPVRPSGLSSNGDGAPADAERCVPYDIVDGVRRDEPERALPCRRRPTQVVGISDAVDIAVGVAHQCAVRATGQVLCWGFNDYGALGTGDTTPRPLPTPVRWY
jgi:alpha-tubulin suppressor-like RCC1 family protein